MKNRTLLIFCFPFYSAFIASTGQTSAQEPQLTHSSGLIEYTSPSEIAPTGHSPIHVPHAAQALESIL